MRLCKLLFVSVGATLVLGALVSSASARNWEITHQRFVARFAFAEFQLPGANLPSKDPCTQGPWPRSPEV
jgi:hypothetical protein